MTESYLEVLTDPSYAGQAVVMTYPRIFHGRMVISGIQDPHRYNSEPSVVSKTKILSEKRGTMNGMITTNGSFDLEEVKERIRARIKVTGVVLKTTTKKHVLPGKKVTLMDFGAKKNIARES